MSADKELHRASPAAAAHIDALLDDALKETFPASDAVAIDIERGLGERGVSGPRVVLADGGQQSIFADPARVPSE